MDALTLLQEARDILAKPYAFTHGEYHTRRTIKGEIKDCYCAIGALRKAAGIVEINDEDPRSAEYDFAVSELCYTANSGSQISSGYIVTSYNDNHKKSEVLALFDTTIARLKENS